VISLLRRVLSCVRIGDQGFCPRQKLSLGSFCNWHASTNRYDTPGVIMELHPMCKFYTVPRCCCVERIAAAVRSSVALSPTCVAGIFASPRLLLDSLLQQKS
jgi:hypothetical protein